MKKVFTCGGASWNSVITLDKFPGDIAQTIHNCNFDETIGNTGAGKALSLSSLGFHTTFHSLIGDDVYGHRVKKELDLPNLYFTTDIDPRGTERHLNILNSEGERISIFINPSSDYPTLDLDFFQRIIFHADYSVINISNYCRQLLPICKNLNKEIWTDLHDYNLGNPYHQDFINAADYIFLSSDNLPKYEDFMYEQIANGKQLVVCTHAKNGASALTSAGKWYDIPIIEEYEMINTNGAGDSFFSGFLYAFDKDYDTQTCLQYATVNAGLCISSEGVYNPQLNSNLLEGEFQKYYG